jgi:class 3 adenylate cyclase
MVLDLIRKVWFYFFQFAQNEEEKPYLDAELKKLLLITHIAIAGSLSAILVVTAPISSFLLPHIDVITWRIYTIGPQLLGFFLLWAYKPLREYIVAVAVLTLLASFVGIGYTSALMTGDLDGPWFYALYIMPIIPAFYPFKIFTRIIATYGLTFAINVGYSIGNPELLEFQYLSQISYTFVLICIGSVLSGHHIFQLNCINIRSQKIIEAEQEKSENLLLNMLPKSIASKLKEDDSVIADSFPSVSILFADIAGFTPLSADLPPEKLVRLLNIIMSKFDELTEKYGLEKIKTIGDAYMVAGGVPDQRADHYPKIANLALDMVESLESIERPEGGQFNIRVGINSGEVVAGVIGTKKFIYDLWGDAVNIASRMESHGEVGKIHITEEFYKHIKEDFITEYRGVVDIKGKGAMQTWWLISRR